MRGQQFEAHMDETHVPERDGPRFKSEAMLIEPFSEAKQALGMSYGLSACGYDIRVGKIDRFTPTKDEPVQSYNLRPGEFLLCSSLERFKIPHNVVAKVHDKSTWARKGLALQNTVLEPGWAGFITLELSNHGTKHLRIMVGQPIAQVLFEFLDEPTELPYVGKYQDQPNEPVHAILLADTEEPVSTGSD
jgi:dCTP deaminase